MMDENQNLNEILQPMDVRIRNRFAIIDQTLRDLAFRLHNLERRLNQIEEQIAGKEFPEGKPDGGGGGGASGMGSSPGSFRGASGSSKNIGSNIGTSKLHCGAVDKMPGLVSGSGPTSPNPC